MDTIESRIERAAQLIVGADALIIAAGAGVSVDSGLPDFRGSRGIWTTLLPAGMRERDLRGFTQARCFSDNPREAWRFFGRALDICRDTPPHAGYALLRDWARSKRYGTFVYTSNVDGQFQAAGFEEQHIVECHGSLHHLQCERPCSPEIWAAPRDVIAARPPRCPRCGGLARPNFLLFSDPSWVVARTNAQRLRMEVWRARPIAPVVIEIGAGVTFPAVRMFAESLRLPVVRINAHEAQVDDSSTVLSLGGTALDILQRIDHLLVVQTPTFPQ